jgi:hypothetical protein
MNFAEAAREDDIQKGFAKAKRMGQAASSRVSCKEAAGLNVVLFHLRFGDGIRRRLLLRVWQLKSPSGPLRFSWLCKMSLNLGLFSTNSREKHTAESVQFGTAIAIFKSFDHSFRLGYCLKSRRGTIC